MDNLANVYKIKRIIGLTVASFVPLSIMIFLLFTTKDVTASVFMGFIAVPLMVLVGGLFINNPFREMIEGKGVIVFDITSSGIIKPFVAYPNMPYIDIKVGKTWFRSIYNRAIGMYLKMPEKAKLDDKGKNLKFELPKEKYSKTYFSLADKPVLFWNSKLKTFLTKEVLAEKENALMVENTALQTLDQVRGMRHDLHELTRTVVDQFKPNSLMELLKNPVFVFIVVIVTIFLIFMFVAPMLPKFLGYIESGTKAIAPGIPIQKG